MKRLKTLLPTFALVILLVPTESSGGGISADAGLTPAEGRWILRTQARVMSRTGLTGMGQTDMDRVVVPFVVVHGATPALTLGARQTFDSRSMSVGGMENDVSGLGDLYLFAKYKLLRVNTRSYTVGISPVLGAELPTGATRISSGALNLRSGMYASGRAGFWATDLNLVYEWRGLAGVEASEPEPGDVFEATLALARQFPLGGSGEVSLAPVVEFTANRTAPNRFEGQDLANSGESVFSVAPGLKFTRGDVIVEGLVRIPVDQKQTGTQTEVGTMYLVGLRRMF